MPIRNYIRYQSKQPLGEKQTGHNQCHSLFAGRTPGVKTNDIIIAIDGVQTTDISSEEIGEMLNPAGKNEVLLTIGNLANPAKQVLVKKECKKGNAITEEQLATAFSMYSLETTSEREFVCPFKTTVTADPVDFGKFKTFAFSAIDENNSKLETAINESIEKD